MSFTESLTVEITADSSRLESELSRVGSFVDEFSSRLASVASQAGSAVDSVSAVGQAIGPINRLNAALDGVVSRLRSIRQTTVTIDVGPALAVLGQLSGAISRVMSQLQQLNAFAGSVRGGLPNTPGLPSIPVGPRDNSPPRFAVGGYVTGPRGQDRVAAYVTAGEFVVRPEVVEQLGRPFFEQLNAGVSPTTFTSSRTSSQSMSTRRLSQVDARSLTQDITIQMSQPVELDDLLSQIELNQVRQSDRFG